MRPGFWCTIESRKAASDRAMDLVRCGDLRSAGCKCQAGSNDRRWSSAPKSYFIEPDQRDLGRPVPWPKIFRLTRRANQWLHSPRPVPSEGRFANVTDVRRDAVDAVAALDGRGKSRTAKSCGPDTPTLVSSFAEAIPQATVARKPGHRTGHRGEHEVTVKTIAQGRPGCFR